MANIDRQEATIAASGSLSGEVVIDMASVVNIYVPTWDDSAAITFQGIASPGETYLDVYDELGQELQLPASTHNRIYPVPGLTGLYAIKIRSGVSGAAVAQTSAVTISVFGLR